MLHSRLTTLHLTTQEVGARIQTLNAVFVFLNLAFVHWKGLTLAGNKVDYHVVAVIDLCLLFLFNLRLEVVWCLKREM